MPSVLQKDDWACSIGGGSLRDRRGLPGVLAQAVALGGVACPPGTGSTWGCAGGRSGVVAGGGDDSTLSLGSVSNAGVLFRSAASSCPASWAPAACAACPLPSSSSLLAALLLALEASVLHCSLIEAHSLSVESTTQGNRFSAKSRAQTAAIEGMARAPPGDERGVSHPVTEHALRRVTGSESRRTSFGVPGARVKEGAFCGALKRRRIALAPVESDEGAGARGNVGLRTAVLALLLGVSICSFKTLPKLKFPSAGEVGNLGDVGVHGAVANRGPEGEDARLESGSENPSACISDATTGLGMDAAMGVQEASPGLEAE
mmetsp:Transcript_7829/g.18195  ORF Transcript_7829/g.18195 Transcript_7829/m.18195 type:complete len:318 (-) Transcript_7829:1519-2472(-)